MTTTNRYAPPKALVEDREGDGAAMWRDGKVLVLRKDAHFPDRCIKCNAPSVAPKRRYRLTWHSSGLYLLLLLAVLIYVIVAALVRKTAVVHVGLCERHQKRVLWGRIIGWGGLALEVLLVWAALATPYDLCGIVAFLLVIPWLVASLVVNRIVLAERIDDRIVRLKGCGPEFLRALPERG